MFLFPVRKYWSQHISYVYILKTVAYIATIKSYLWIISMQIYVIDWLYLSCFIFYFYSQFVIFLCPVHYETLRHHIIRHFVVYLQIVSFHIFLPWLFPAFSSHLPSKFVVSFGLTTSIVSLTLFALYLDVWCCCLTYSEF